jgi:AcrR family transcriptional regulator
LPVVSTERSSAASSPVAGKRWSGARRAGRTEAILDATFELLVEVGYDRLTIDAVAARARASKATIYNRWSSKRDLVVAAYQREGAELVSFEPNGTSLREELLSLLDAMRKVSRASDARAFLSLLAASQQDASIGEAIRENLYLLRGSCAAILDRSAARGDISVADLDFTADKILGLIIGQVIVRQLVFGIALDDDFLTELVDELLVPLLSRDVVY